LLRFFFPAPRPSFFHSVTWTLFRASKALADPF
jgi:hypothetical protein